MQGTAGRDINDFALISGNACRQDRGESQCAGKARAFHLMNAPRGQTAMRHPAIHGIHNWNDTREPPLRLFQTAEPFTEFFKGWVRGHFSATSISLYSLFIRLKTAGEKGEGGSCRRADQLYTNGPEVKRAIASQALERF
jgi:hypothetical protein